MAAVTRRPHPLHNFSLPSLKWGNQRNLRCVKGKTYGDKSSAPLRSSSSSSDSEDSSTRASPPLSLSPSSPLVKSGISAEADHGIKKVRQKLLAHLDAVVAPAKDRGSPEAEGDGKAWDSKKRRAPAPCSAPIEVRGRVSGADDGAVKSDAPLSSLSRPKSLRLRGLAPTPVMEEKKMEMPTLSIPLTKQEIEEDFLAMTGLKPPRRPKKRPRAIQKKLNETFPGLWLCDITPDSYKIPDQPEPRTN
ncbi:hypothetical protein H6P81_010571 [Aristolochia fimbriata]|uniref:Uncharacterized protein n=1 Tax=Aristolochia fimbriata TaxID=158543 RepID=A0AAV7EQA6_ARIFI|nr:hypothetical protein H6P81_010571 [Aristolochia fimbriata]